MKLDGYPHATVVDEARMQSVQGSYAIRLHGDDLDLRDRKYWSMVVPPSRTHKFCRGVNEQETIDLRTACLEYWATYTAGFGQFDTK